MTDYKRYHRDSDYVKMESTFTNIFEKRFKLIQKYKNLGDIKKVLDIGCSNGLFLDLFKKNNIETWGVEPSKNSKIAILKGHKILGSEFEKANLPKDYFDLVILNHTLEHLRDPKIILDKAYTLLRKNGILFIDVPNAGSLLSKIMGKRWPYLLPEEHLWQFNKKSLSKIVENSGFEIVHWESRSGIFEYANPVKELKRKRFVIDIISSPFSSIATLLNMGDSMSIIGYKHF